MKEFNIEEYDGKPIIIYGATVGGKIIYQCLAKAGLKAAFFCDRSLEKSSWYNCEVKNPLVLETLKDANVLIALTRSFNSAYQYLKEIQYEKVFSCTNLLKGKEPEEFEYDANEKNEVTDFLNKYSIYANGIESETIELASLELFITERCTLRCRDCSHLIPFYQKPQNYIIEDLLLPLQNLLQAVDKIEDLIVLGGEPLLHPELYKILEWAYMNEKIAMVTIISNASICPDEKNLQSIIKTNTRLRLSDYGKYSIKLGELEVICRENEISYAVNKETWTDMGVIRHHNYSEEALYEIFHDCPFSYSLLLLNGRLFRCAHVAHLYNLNKIEGRKEDYLDFNNLEQDAIEIMKQKLRDYMKCDYLYGCNYCNGIANSIQGVEPAIQISEEKKLKL